MMFFESVTFDQIVISLMATIALGEALVVMLPDSVAGPHGWLVRTGDEN